MSPPISSHTEMVMLPVLSATLQDLTSWPSLVLVTRPISRTIKTTFKFFSPALMSFIKRGGSLTPCILRQVRLRCARQGFPPSGAGAEPGWGSTLGRGWRPGQEAVIRGPGKPALEAPSQKRERKNNGGGREGKRTLPSSKIKKRTHSAHRARSQVGGEQASVRTAASAQGKGSRGWPCPSPAVPHTTHAHARDPSVPGSGKGPSQQNGNAAHRPRSPRPKQQLANAPSSRLY